ncbi:MAG: MFS transporter [Candidatus Nitrosocosmicus sp.]
MSFLAKSLSAPVLSLIFARVLYAINWFNISSIFYLILIDFRQDVSMLGLVTASFLLGIGIFQVPAGILAAKYDPKKIAAFGIMMLSISSLLSGLATELFQIAILRFLVGVGMAFFFGPSVILISAYLGKGSDGLGVGILNSAHSLGGIIGLFGWIVIAQNVGWRASLIFGGILGIVTGILLIYGLKQKRQQQQQQQHDGDKDNGHLQHPLHNDFKLRANDKEHGTQQSDFKIKLSDLRLVLINKQMIIVGLSLLGIQIGWNLVSTFVVLYLKNDLHASPYFAGMVAGLAMVLNVVFAPIFGRIYDKTTRMRNRNLGLILLIVCGVVVSVNIALFSLENIYVIVLSIMMIGIFISGGFVVPYTKAREIAIIKLNQRHYETLAVSFVNGLSLFGAFWVPFVFSIVVLYFGYPTAWMIGGFLTILFIIPIVKLAV